MLQTVQNKSVKTMIKRWGLVTWCLFTGLFVGIRPLQAADAVVGAGTPASCTEGAFDTALFAVQNSGGGAITFNCGANNHSIGFFAGSTGKIIDTNVVIDANNNIVLNAFNERRHFYIESNGSLTLQNITLVQGRNNTGNGGSIYNLGALSLKNTTIVNSNVAADYSGGAIVSNGGAVTITDSRLENNTAGSGGGLYLIGENADATITNSIFRNNQTTNANFGFGGAIQTIDGADVIIHNSMLEGNQAVRGGAIDSGSAATTITIEADTKLLTNTATIEGGGIYNTGTFSMSNSTVAGNTAPYGAGVRNTGGNVTLRNSTVVSNTGATGGGGIYNYDGSVMLANSTVAGNTAPFGAGVRNFGGSVILTNSTVVSNTGANLGGGILNFGAIGLGNSTIAGNMAAFGGGIYNDVITSVVTITNSAVVSNTGTTGGGGIFNVGSLTVNNSTVARNTSPFGGGVNNNSGSATITNSTVVSNTGSTDGGGIFNAGSVTVTNSTVAGNTASFGGGVRNRGGSVILTDSTLVSNTGANWGGGILNFGAIALSNSTVAGNMAPFGGGIYNDVITSTVTMTNSTVVSNTGAIDGGGIFNSGAITLSNSTVAGNTAPFGGGVRNGGGRVILTNSTVVSNTATNQGGGIYNFGTFSLTNGTIADNTAAAGGGIYNVDASSFVTLTNSIIANSLNSNDCSSAGTIVSQGYNLDSDNTCHLTATGDITSTNPLLGPLQANGGATFTRALLVGSPAIDSIPNGANGCGATMASDQRGVVRPQGLGCDIGAFEVVYINHPPVANTQTLTTSVDTAKAITLTASDADNDVLTYTITISPTNGTLSGTAPNLTYTPKAGFSGSDSFTFRVHDGTVDSGAAVVTILVEEQGNTNHPPIAGADTVTTSVGVTITINVLANDADPDGDPLTVTINQQPQNGRAVVNGVTIVYTPNAGFSGTDSFIYTVTDSKGATANATITITITVQPPAEGTTIYLPIVNK